MNTDSGVGGGPTDLTTAYAAELQCFLCGTLAGTFEAPRKPLPPSGIWRPVGGPPMPISNWRLLRCTRCGGALFTESVEAVARYDEVDEATQNTPRRGRPPRWLVEQRRRQAESAQPQPR